MSRDDEKNMLNSIFLGEISSVYNYGAFVRIPGNKNQGLIHRTQISRTSKVEDATEVLDKGDKIWCKVININGDGKIGLSMKVVNQTSGADLDPNGVDIQQDELKRKTYVPGQKNKPIQLQAILNTTCSKCGTKGHLGKDCFKSPDGKIYDLIPETNEGETSTISKELLEKLLKESGSKEKSKKSKKRKKSESEDSELEYEKKKKKKKIRKEKKKKSKKHKKSDSSDSEEESRTKKKHKKH